MISSLFSSFDPISGLINLNYISTIPLLISPIVLESVFNNQSRNNNITNVLYNSVNEEIQSTVTNKYNTGNISILITLFFLILIMNISGLVPYVFTATAHILLTLSLALPFWLGFVAFSIFNNTNHFFSHLVPLSTPLPLSQFMVLIETVSQLIRPITLSVRLAANMTAGHILIGLASSNVVIFNISSSILCILLILESAVAFIQSYVFTILLSIYMNES